MPHWMLECAARASLIALGTAAVLGLLRVKSAGARHAAWTGVLALMLLLQTWMAWGPRASLPLLPAKPAPSAFTPIVISLDGPAAVGPAVPAPRASWNWLAIAYCTGAFILLARLALGTLRARTITSTRCAAPVTVGLLKPRVILPDGWREWPAAQLDAVLAHEGAHVRRHDPLVQWVALLNRAIFWFHPLAWWLERHLSALAEEACDAAVLQSGHDPRDYSGYLLELARTVASSGARLNVVGMAMPGSSLPRRIRQMLTSGPAPRLSRVRAVCLTMACAALSTVFAAASVSRESFISDPPLPPAPPAAAISKSEPQQPAQQELKYRDRRLLVLYFDLDGTPAEVQTNAIASAAAFVRFQMQPNDLVAIMTSSLGAVKVVEDFTDDRDKLNAAVPRLSFSPDGQPDAATQLRRLDTATKMLGVLQGKKSILYFSKGFAQDNVTQAELAATVNSAIRANVAFYPINARGLVLRFPLQIAVGDTVAISMPDGPVFNGTYTVRADGVLALPVVGDIKAAGLSAQELQAALDKLGGVKISVVGVRKGDQ